jgi:uncharacterized protein (DUF1810 family)
MSHDAYDLDRFVRAQETDYERALSEITAGRKQTHWMWYIFPQLEGLGRSRVSAHYAISGTAEAGAYLAHPVLGPRLVECAEAVLLHKGTAASGIFGYPDDLKLRSSATLFAAVSPPGSVFHQIIDAFFQGQADETTLRRLQSNEPR